MPKVPPQERDDEAPLPPKRRASARQTERRRKAARSPSPVNVAYDGYDGNELMFYHAADRAVRRRIADLEDRIGEINEDAVPLRFRVLLSDMDDAVKAVAMKKVDSMADMDSGSGYQKIKHWVDGLCALPIGKYKSMPIQHDAPRAEVGAFLGGMRARLDAAVHGHAEAKGHIVRLLAQWITNPTARGLVLGVHGPPGIGKTELCKAVCDVLGLPFAFVPLGGANDGAYLDGHSYTYEGSMWGKVADVLMKCRVMNPVLFFDELDKVSESRKGEEIVNLLIHLTDPTQNDRFNDKFFLDVDLDLSKCLCVFSYNDESRISPILRDRMVRVRTEGYATKDKLQIARGHLVPGVLSQFGLKGDDVRFGNAELTRIVETVEEEQGVRNLKRGIHDVVSCLNFARLVGEPEAACGVASVIAFPVDVTGAHVDAYVRTGRRDGGGGSATAPWRTMYA